MQDEIRLVIWDLDETFWSGTLIEGGIVVKPGSCELVRTLAARGIMNSICSKNDFESVKSILEEQGIWNYFIFPSINWEPKGPRVAALVAAVQLRTPSVMFIDDNPRNLAEVAEAVPGIHVCDETFIPEIASHARFAGKDDRQLTRLAQYKLMETRTKDEPATGRPNAGFLRQSDIRVYIEYDIAAHIDRAIELINRTNQLNYTKRRLPEDMREARRILGEQLAHHGFQAGLVNVIDRYGDYGFVGFYLLRNFRSSYPEGKAPQELIHYCFSCRTLGMSVDKWLYDYLRQPELRVVGEVLTDLARPQAVDWVRVVSSPTADGAAQARLAPSIRLYGGCEVNAVAHYLTPHTEQISVAGNFAAGGVFVRVNSVALLQSARLYRGPTLQEEAAKLDIPYAMLAPRYLDDAPAGSVFVFDGGFDASPSNFYYQHKDHGWVLKLEPASGPGVAFTDGNDKELRARLARLTYGSPAWRERTAAVAEHVRKSYRKVMVDRGETLAGHMRALFASIPMGCKMFVLLPAEAQPVRGGPARLLPWLRDYNTLARNVTAHFPYVNVVDYEEFVEDASEKHGFDHYDRMVHLRVAQAIAARAPGLPPR